MSKFLDLLNEFVKCDINDKKKSSHVDNIMNQLINQLKEMNSQEVIEILKINRSKMTEDHAIYLYQRIFKLKW